MKKRKRKLDFNHQKEVEKLAWVAGTLARREANNKNLGNATHYEDLYQVASWGICAAVYDWSPDGGKAISSYAWDRAFAYIGHYMRDKSRIIKIPRKIQKLYYKWCELTKHPQMTLKEILEELNCTIEELEEAKKVGVSTPFQLFPETLKPEQEYYEDAEDEDNDIKRVVLNHLSQVLSDEELDLCLRYFNNELKKKNDKERAVELITSLKETLISEYGFTLEHLQ